MRVPAKFVSHGHEPQATEHDKDGYFAFVPELKGCHTQGDSLDDLMKNIKEAIDLHWSTLPPVGQ